MPLLVQPALSRLRRGRTILVWVAGLLFVAVGRAEECEQLQLRWRTGNYGLADSTGWPQGPDNRPLGLYEVDPLLADLRRQILSRYSQFHSGRYGADEHGIVPISALQEQLVGLQGLALTQPSPRVAEQLRALRASLRRAYSRLHEEVDPLRRRHDALQALCRQARTRMRDLLLQHCGSVPEHGFELANWERLPPPPELKLPSLPPGLDLGPEPQEASTPTPIPTELNPLWAELERRDSAAAAPTPGQAQRAEEPPSLPDAAPNPSLTPPSEPRAGTTPSVLPTPPAVGRSDHERFLSLLATPDEEEEEAGEPSAFAQTWSGLPAEGLVTDPNERAPIRETTLAAADVPVPGEARPSAPFAAGKRPAPAAPLERPRGATLLAENFSAGLGPERVGGTWSIDHRVLAGRGTIAGGESLYVLSREPWVNFELEMDIAIDGGQHEAGLVLRSQAETFEGKAVRSQDEQEDAYLVRIRANQARQLSFHDSVDVALRRGGKLEKVLCGTNADLPPRRWHKLNVRVEFGRFEISLEGKPLLSCSDETLAAGATWLRLAGDTEARFDNIWVREIPAEGSDLLAPRGGVQIPMPGPGATGWSELGGRFVRLGSVLFAEAGRAAPGLARRDLADVLAIAGLDAADALQLQVEVRSVGKPGGGGLLLLTEGGKHYAAVLGPSEDPRSAIAQLLYRRGEAWDVLASEAVPLDVTQWHRVGLVRRAETIELQVDGRTALRGRTTLPPVAGAGIYAAPGARVLADRLVVAVPM
jgi:hypothetical protein